LRFQFFAAARRLHGKAAPARLPRLDFRDELSACASAARSWRE
jgi:hypothetical protein